MVERDVDTAVQDSSSSPLQRITFAQHQPDQIIYERVEKEFHRVARHS